MMMSCNDNLSRVSTVRSFVSLFRDWRAFITDSEVLMTYSYLTHNQSNDGDVFYLANIRIQLHSCFCQQRWFTSRQYNRYFQWNLIGAHEFRQRLARGEKKRCPRDLLLSHKLKVSYPLNRKISQHHGAQGSERCSVSLLWLHTVAYFHPS